MFNVDPKLAEGDFASREVKDYHIAPGDRLSLVVFTNKGYNQINTMVTTFGGGGGGSSLEYLVYSDGQADLPVIGLYRLSGMSIREAEESLAKLYDEKGFRDPLVILRVLNRRAYVYNGQGASVITLENERTTLMEAITMGGGIAERAKAHRIRLIREVDGKRVVQMVDMSGDEALANADLIIEANDIIYVEPLRPVTTALREVTSWVAIGSSTLSALAIILALSRP